ncbi:hypothetical protein VNO78_00333 [Psophocarpus tetragonolobus]|uniref:Transmembrane protein n=1 Tax=Psophocarpus tetragonolobus TaxID=3891 RepID=A0AAN9SXY5_PSOTE
MLLANPTSRETINICNKPFCSFVFAYPSAAFVVTLALSWGLHRGPRCSNVTVEVLGSEVFKDDLSGPE